MDSTTATSKLWNSKNKIKQTNEIQSKNKADYPMAKHLKGTLILKNENPVIIKQLTKHIEMAPYSLSSVIQFSGSPEIKD